jgi:hypothetical protein
LAILSIVPLRYLTRWLGFAGFLAAMVGGINIVVDPWYVFGMSGLPGINQRRPAAADRPWSAKEHLLSRICADTLLLGNSRIESGLDPESPAWPASTGTVFNAAAAGAAPEYSLGMLRRAVAGDCPPQVAILSVDYPDFLVPPSSGSAQPVGSAQHPWLAATRDRLEATLTLGALQDSFATLASQWTQNGRTLTAQGFNPLAEYAEIASVSGYHTLFQHKLRQLERELRTAPRAALQEGSSRPLDTLVRTIRLAKEAGVTLHLIIPPYHASYLDLIGRMGRRDEFQAWKDVVAREARRAGLRLIDFSAPHALTAEAIPAAGDRATKLRYYWESGHFKSSLGDHIIEHLFSTGTFGIALASPAVASSGR